MRILTEQELRRAVDSTVRRTLAENSQDESIGKWLLTGAAALLGIRYWPQIKKLFGGGDSGSQTPPQGPSMPPSTPPSTPPSSTGSGYTDITLPSSSGYSDGQLEDWQKEWRRMSGQSAPSFKDAPPQARIDGQTKPSDEHSALDKVDAILSNPMELRRMSRDDIRLLLMYRMMLSNESRPKSISRPSNTYHGYARGHKPSKTRASRSTSRPSIPSRGYAPGHRMK